jgi:hypothetical protein
MTAEPEAFTRGAAEAERAIAARAPLTDEELEAGWEDPGGSGLRWNRLTGEYDDSLFVAAPSWYRSYRAAVASDRGRPEPSGS